ncbi:MAG: DEAD/DEAH box helicase family protein [Candidatus Accumulibacter sp. UW20]|jgi:superfamily II DNA or RNA helicase/very-short-patch-repair endonuclease
MNADSRVSRHSSVAPKIALFRSLFRGREDVYARRFESRRTGKSGYSPACVNEWVRGVCAKPAVKCHDCPHRRFLPLDDETIRQHLAGEDASGNEFVSGVYPMLLDESCFFLAADFDKAHWHEDLAAVRETCRALGLPVAIERSRSGNGGHLWLFFAEAIPAILARKLGAHLLTETMEKHPDIGFDSYDRFFPNQDTLPRGGFGNLIALPLQKRPRASGNTVFVDDDWLPWPDQWAFLAAVRKLARVEVEAIVRAAENRGRVVGVRLPLFDEGDAEPWTTPPSRRRVEPPLLSPLPGPLPASVQLVLGNEIYIAREGLPAALRNRLLRVAAFQNPEFYRAQAMRLPTFGKPRIVSCAEEHPLHIGLPRGCLEETQELLSGLGIECVLRDERHKGVPLNVSFQGLLRPRQQVAADALLAHDQGVLAATTAFGKTVVAAWLIARRGVSTLILVHRQQLMEQWVERLSTFLGLPAKAIGRIGGGRNKPNGRLDVALIQSLVRTGVVDDRVGDYGQLVFDECHHLPAKNFEQLARRAKARFVLGLSATVSRKDGQQPIIFMQCGPVRHCVDAREAAATRPFSHSVRVCPTGFRPPAASSVDPDLRHQFNALYRALISDQRRNRLIVGDVTEALREGRSPLVLTERIDHLDILAEQLSPLVRHLVVLRGGMGGRPLKEVRERLAAIAANEERVVLATGSTIGEGYDDARLDTLFLTLPVSWRGTIAQYAGRLHRLHDSKREVRIHDYADLEVPMLARMFDRRCKGYEALGYSIVLPASAVPGWPPEVPLPVDPQWKQNYAASVQRLVRDGVDAQLGSLFVHVAHEPDAAAQGVEQARSASEAFLYRRLETLAESAGKFRLNADLPISFDGHGAMEVDLLAADARLAIEIDGGQHLNDPEAYRRDRRKDALLQENGYFVLRFLAEDFGKHLDDVLDAILRALAHRQRER